MGGQTRVFGRFAPSPTGPLHFGSLLTALASHCEVKSQGGSWLVRMEDVDEPRCDAASASGILATLEAHGLAWDGPVVVQSERKALYAAALERLQHAGAVYPCTCSRKDLEGLIRRNGMGEWIYPGTCRTGEAKPHASQRAWRFRTGSADGEVSFEDGHYGVLSEDVAREVGDFVVKRADGYFAYQLAVVVDDFEQGMTHVVRGSDLLHATPRQIMLQRALGFPTPRYLHIPVATNGAGEKLSKQTKAPPLDPRHASETLVRALVALGQEVPAGAARLAPRALVEEAIRRWDASRLPPVLGFAVGPG